MVRIQFGTDFKTMIEVDGGKVFIHQYDSDGDCSIVEFSRERWREVCNEVNDALCLG